MDQRFAFDLSNIMVAFILVYIGILSIYRAMYMLKTPHYLM